MELFQFLDKVSHISLWLSDHT